MDQFVIFLSVLYLTVPIYVNSQQESASDAVNQRFCYRFTWLGPQFNAESHFINATCEHHLNGVTGIPCHHPLVVTNNSNVPDTNYMWYRYQDNPLHIACRLAPGDVCVKYTYSFNHAVQNITYFCTKVNIENEGAATSGCYMEYRNGREIEVCICESRPGEKPCNDATKMMGHIVGLFVVGFVIVLQQWAFR